MSLITCCPACRTMFRVVPDQLRISEGWVRCGHCAEVFDATAHMAEHGVAAARDEGPETQPNELAMSPPVAESPAPPERGRIGSTPLRRAGDAADGVPAWPGPTSRRPASPGAGGLAEAAGAVGGVGALTGAGPAAARGAIGRAAAHSLPASPPATRDVEPLVRDAGETLEASALDVPFVFRRPALDHSLPPADEGMAHAGDAEGRAFEPARDSRPADLPAPDSRSAPLQPAGADAELDEVSFVRQARRRAFWRRPLVRVSLALVSTALAAVLLLQLAYDERHRLAAAQPHLRPALEQMCAVLHCQVGPPRQIEALVIESSSFSRLRGDTYRLSFTLRNTAPIDVAAPSLEVTLTDTQDQPVLRRVLTAAELGARSPVIGTSSDWTSTVGLAVASTGGPRVAGYRLLAFYP